MSKGLCLLIFALAGCSSMNSYTIAEIAASTKCKPDAVREWVIKNVEYFPQEDWEDSNQTIERGHGDYKGFITIIRDVMAACDGYTASVIKLQGITGVKVDNAAVVYRDVKGTNGFIHLTGNGYFRADEHLMDVLPEFPGGPWRIVPEETVILKSVDEKLIERGITEKKISKIIKKK